MSTGRVENVVRDRIAWNRQRAETWRKRYPDAPPVEEAKVEAIDLAYLANPIEKVKSMDAVAQASAHTGCRPGAITVYNPADRSITVCPVRCKKWTCPKCGPLLARIWAKRIADAGPERMITLTCDHAKWPHAFQAYEAMRAALPKLVRLIREKVGPLEYAAVWELHEDGYPHIHLAARGHYIPQKWLSLTWSNLGIGSIVDVRRIKTGKGAALYLSKYMTKTVTAVKDEFQLTRVIQASKGYFEKTVISYKSYVPPGGQAERCRGEPYDIVRHLTKHCGYVLDQERPGPPWRFVPAFDEAHSKPIEQVLCELGSC